MAFPKILVIWGLKYVPIYHRSFKKTRTQKRADRIESLAKQLSLPNSAIGKGNPPEFGSSTTQLKVQPFVDPNPFQELTFSTVIAAKLAIADYLARPLAKLTSEQMTYIDAVLVTTLSKQEVMKQIRDFFHPSSGTSHVE